MDIEEVLVPDLADRAQNAEQKISLGWQGLQRHRQGCGANQNRQVNRQEVIDDVWRQAYYLSVEGNSPRKNAQEPSGRLILGQTHLRATYHLYALGKNLFPLISLGQRPRNYISQPKACFLRWLLKPVFEFMVSIFIQPGQSSFVPKSFI